MDRRRRHRRRRRRRTRSRVRGRPTAALLALVALVGLGSCGGGSSGGGRTSATARNPNVGGSTAPAPAGTTTAPAQAAGPATTWIGTAGSRFVDQAGRPIVLRGFVTLPDLAGGGYRLADYRRMKGLGANFQSIRITIGALGFNRGGGQPAPGYLAQLQSMVTLAERTGIYSDFKLAVYDVPHFDWTSFWLDAGHQQERFIAAWTRLWGIFAGRPAVVGYDLLNEPSMGSLGIAPAAFQRRYLNPFYLRLIRALRRIDTRHVAFFQPEVEPRLGIQPYLAPLVTAATPAPLRAQLALAVHYYPPQFRYSTAADRPLLAGFLAEAARNRVPLLVGEYGLAWNPVNDGNARLQARYEVLERAMYALFAQYHLSYSRPWYCATAQQLVPGAAGGRVTWAIIAGNRGLRGRFRPWIVRPFAQAARAA